MTRQGAIQLLLWESTNFSLFPEEYLLDLMIGVCFMQQRAGDPTLITAVNLLSGGFSMPFFARSVSLEFYSSLIEM